MYRNKKITVVIPCRNEAAHLREVVRRIPKYIDEIIVVSNCSTDDTVKEAKKLKLRVFEDNRTIDGIGYGFAHMTGIKHASGDLIAAIDGDATYPIEDLGKIIDYLLDENIDFLSCNRYPLQAGTHIPLKLRLGVNTLNFETRVLYGIKIKDILSGMWVFDKSVKSKLKLTMGDWNLSPQIKINAASNSKIVFKEYSIAQYQRLGTSKQRHFKTGYSHAKWLLSNRLGNSKIKKVINLTTLKFLVVGACAFIVNYLILRLLKNYFFNSSVISEVISMIIVLNLTFFVHDNWTYYNKNKAYERGILARYLGYLLSNSTGSIITIVLFALFSRKLSNLPALAIAATISMCWNYIMNIIIWHRKNTRTKNT